MSKKSASLSSVWMGLIVVGAVLFGMDYLANSSGSTDALEGSLLTLQVGDQTGTLGKTDTPTPPPPPPTETDPIDVTEPAEPDPSSGEGESFSLNDPTVVDPIATTPNTFDSLVAKNIFTKQALVSAGYAGASLEDVKTSNLLFDHFTIPELGETALITKQALILDDKLVAYVYAFPAEAYARGLNYDSVVAAVQDNLPATHLYKSPSELAPTSFYVTPKEDDVRGRIYSVVLIDDTLVAVEYPSTNYALVKEIMLKLTE